MSDFDNLIKPADFDEVERLLSQDRDTKRTSTTSGKKAKQKTLMEMLAGSNDAGALARKLNVDPDMSEKVIVPLLNFLDKYGVGGAVSDSPTAQAATGLIEFLTDITPVVKESMDYFAGRQKELSQTDLDFLNQIKDAQTENMDGLFIGENLEEEVVVEPAPIPEPKTQKGQIPNDVDPFSEGVDWESVIGVKKTITPLTMEPSESYIQGLERLAAESGMTMDQIKKSDRQTKTNTFGRGGAEIDYSNAFTIDLGLEKINSAMEGEKKRMKSSSLVDFEVTDELPVPDSVEGYDPLGEPNYTIPSFTGTLATVDDLSNSAGVDLTETPWNDDDYDPASDEITLTTDKEVEVDDSGE